MSDAHWRKLHELDIAPAGPGRMRITADGSLLIVDFERSSMERGRVRFRHPRAHRHIDFFRGGMVVPGERWDVIGEIRPSPWIAELRAIDPDHAYDFDSMHHFTLFLVDNGYLEVVAEGVDEPTFGQGEVPDLK